MLRNVSKKIRGSRGSASGSSKQLKLEVHPRNLSHRPAGDGTCTGHLLKVPVLLSRVLHVKHKLLHHCHLIYKSHSALERN